MTQRTHWRPLLETRHIVRTWAHPNHPRNPMTHRNLLSTLSLSLFAAAGCGDDHEHSHADELPTECAELVELCHDADTGMGAATECHTTGHAGDAAACTAARTECIAACAEPSVAVEINFAAEINGEAFGCGEVYDGVGSPAAEFQVSDFRFFVHDVALLAADGTEFAVSLETSEFQNEGVVLLDFEDASSSCTEAGSVETNTSVTGMVPDGVELVGLRFSLGVPYELNHRYPTDQTAPLNEESMFWTWLGGYKFVRIDGQGVSGDTLNPFFIHLGSTGCPGESQTEPPTGPCTYPNVVTVEFDSFDPATQTIVADLGRLLEDSDVMAATAETAPGCMSSPMDPECTAILDAFGIATDGSITAQKFFSVR
jgi:uncharacterized repeat protein (TIGR04052 family)